MSPLSRGPKDKTEGAVGELAAELSSVAREQHGTGKGPGAGRMSSSLVLC